ncbi:MAG: bifunctional riboflavin kinase/FAD synthetase [Pirellula sp.]
MSSHSRPWTNGCVLTIGNFDGVHLGHRSLIEKLIGMGTRLNLPSVVFSFDPPPLRLLRPEIVPKPLTWNMRREALLKNLGVDFVHFYPTTHELLQQSPSEFFEQLLVEKLGLRGLVEGPNFRFGKDRAGDVQTLRELCAQYRVELDIAEPQLLGDRLVSSTQIREWIEQGDLRSANELLVEPYRIAGRVSHGAARGRTLGFPTANLEQIQVLVPRHGVYAARVVSPVDLACLPVGLNIGPNPTFGEDTSKVEAHLLDFHGDLYGRFLEVEILECIRGIRKFQSKDELISQLGLDIERVRSIVNP